MILAARLGSISPVQVQSALDRFELGTFVAASPVLAGVGGQNVFIESTTGQFVLRGNPLFPGQLGKERFFADMLHGRTSLRVPWPYYHDPNTDIFGWSYALMPRLAGISVLDPATRSTLTEGDRPSIAEGLANGLAALHDVTGPSPGEYQPDTDAIEPLAVPFGAWIVDGVRAKMRRAEAASEELSAADIGWVESLLQQAKSALSEPFTPCFVMHDYQVANVLFTRSGGVWRVSAVFDFAEAYIGDGEADLARPMRMLALDDEALARAFLRRYLELRPPRPGFAERFAVYALDDFLAGWVHARKMGYRDRSKSFRELSEPFTSLALRLL